MNTVDCSSQNEKNIETTGITILVADDRYENRYYLEKLLTGNGYRVILVKDGEEALNIINNETIDVIVTDILMPGQDGYDICKAIKGDPKTSHIPLIFYTASYTEKRHIDYGFSIGADEYIIKPSEPGILLDVIRRFLHHDGCGKNLK
ncbi:MAG: response regulator [Methanomicrobiales archaeon]|nr:response regulator [Methanomicrobiales archaeon]